MLRRIVVSLGGRAGAAVAQALLLALLARALGLADFGVYAAFYAGATFAIGVLDYGLTTRVLAAGGVEDARGIFGALIVSKTFAFALVAILSGVLISQIGAGWPSGLAAAALVAAAGESVGNTTLAIQQGEKKSLSGAALMLGRRLVTLLPFLFGLSVPTAIASMIVGGVMGVAAFYAIAIRRSGRPTAAGPLFRANYPVFLASLGPNLMQLDTAVVGVAGGAALAGAYGAATRLAAPLNLAITTVTQVVVPEIATESNEARRRKIFVQARRTAVLVGACFVITIPFAPLITDVLLGSAFSEAAPIVGGVIAAAAMIAISQVYLGWFYATIVPRAVGYSILGSAAFRLGASWAAAALGGAWALAFVLPATSLITVVALHVIWLKRTRHEPGTGQSA